MFVSANFLAMNYGVDDAIARFFVDRQPPVDNLYWQGKLMYLRTEPGWLFIPLIVDLLFKTGIDKEQLLSEEYVSLMEKIGHISAKEELKQITKNEALIEYNNLVKYHYQNNSFYCNIVDFMEGGDNNPFTLASTPFKALHRGDAFLFSLCALRFDQILAKSLVENWFALISTLLLLDDAEDVDIDKSNGDENAFLESSQIKMGSATMQIMIKNNLQRISKLNKVMAKKLDQRILSIIDKPQIKPYLNT